MNLILASTSPFRKEQLERLPVTFSTDSPNVDEEMFKNKIFTPNDLAKQLAFEKANAIFTKNESSSTVVIGGDQVLSFNNEILGKPDGEQGAYDQLFKLQGNEHSLITSICILSANKKIEHTCIAKMKMRKLNKDEVLRYIKKDNPIYCCGSYMLEKSGISLFEKIECDDYTSIIGMPLIFITSALRQLGFQVP